jgi:hypothetical protein
MAAAAGSISGRRPARLEGGIPSPSETGSPTSVLPCPPPRVRAGAAPGPDRHPARDAVTRLARPARRSSRRLGGSGYRRGCLSSASTAPRERPALLYQALERDDLRWLLGDPSMSGENEPQMLLRIGYGPQGPATPRRPADDATS